MTRTADALREEVRRHYAAAAKAAEGGGCPCAATAFYGDRELADLPQKAVLASLGCGNPVPVAELAEGEAVLDLGSGGGIDVILAARRVGTAGVVYGLDMTEEMLALARQNAAEAGVTNVHFLKGTIEAIPLPARSVDAVISNCVLNLSVDKPAVLLEMARVLKPGGRLAIADVVADDSLSAEQRATLGSYADCVAGALSTSEYLAGLEEAGFADVSVDLLEAGSDGVHGAIVRARKP